MRGGVVFGGIGLLMICCGIEFLFLSFSFLREEERRGEEGGWQVGLVGIGNHCRFFPRDSGLVRRLRDLFIIPRSMAHDIQIHTYQYPAQKNKRRSRETPERSPRLP